MQRPLQQLLFPPSTSAANHHIQVIPEAGVRAYAECLSTAQPGRHVALAALSGPHCQLAQVTPSELVHHLEALVAVAGL